VLVMKCLLSQDFQGGRRSFTIYASKIQGATKMYVGVMVAWHVGFVDSCSVLMTRDSDAL
jgi:hypothetical protein